MKVGLRRLAEIRVARLTGRDEFTIFTSDETHTENTLKKLKNKRCGERGTVLLRLTAFVLVPLVSIRHGL